MEENNALTTSGMTARQFSQLEQVDVSHILNLLAIGP